MESLQLLPFDQWLTLRDSFLKDFPRGVPGYYFIDMMLKYEKLRHTLNLRLYCVNGNIKNGYVAFMEKENLKQIVIQTTLEDTKALRDALKSTKLIEWDHFEIPFSPLNTLKCVSNIGFKLTPHENIDMMFLTKDSKPYDIVLPEGTYLSQVQEKHIEQVNDVWPHKYPSSPWLYRLLIQLGLSWGLFSNTDDSLIAWLFLCEAGFLLHLYCMEKHRRKGYAEFMVKYVSNQLLNEGKDVFCYIVPGNSNSMNLFRKLGFESVAKVSWIVVDLVQ